MAPTWEWFQYSCGDKNIEIVAFSQHNEWSNEKIKMENQSLQPAQRLSSALVVQWGSFNPYRRCNKLYWLKLSLIFTLIQTYSKQLQITVFIFTSFISAMVLKSLSGWCWILFVYLINVSLIWILKVIIGYGIVCGKK